MTGSFIFIFAALFVIGVLAKWLSSPGVKGLLGEQAVHAKLTKSLPAAGYTILRDVTLPSDRGTSQIDHIVVSRFGLLVIETKNMSGWIFGSEKDREWTQSFRGGTRRRFQNPLRQNYAHICALQALLGLDAGVFHSIIVFVGSAEFKKQMPPEVVSLSRLLPYILDQNTPLLSAEEVAQAVRAIEASRLQPGAETNTRHVESLRATHGSLSGAVDEARGLMRHGVKALIAVKALAGVAAVLLVVVGANLMLNAVSGLLDPAMPTPAVSDAAPTLPGGQRTAPAAQAAQRQSLDALGTLQQQQAARIRQRERERELAWRASLMCGYSIDTMRCACYDPKAGKVEMPFDECKALADGELR